MIDLLIGIILLAIIGTAVGYIYKTKKRGTGCVGCPEGGNCSRCSKGDGKGCH